MVLDVPDGLVEQAADLLGGVVDESFGQGRGRSGGQAMAGCASAGALVDSRVPFRRVVRVALTDRNANAA
ncbi:hypothetical protein OS965_36600, partial [Streptomyces sp. H27-G5]|uniref:hypothetical protein n=1 Tax=Streptomyces sp. H27-G5 TaxID=2996698 RepID=UPI00226DB7BD